MRAALYSGPHCIAAALCTAALCGGCHCGHVRVRQPTLVYEAKQPPKKRQTPMSALGQKQTFSGARRMSALPPKADIAERHWDVR